MPGPPYLAPSIYHLMSHLDLADGVLYPRGGSPSSSRPSAGGRAGVRIHTGTGALPHVSDPGPGGPPGVTRSAVRASIASRDRPSVTGSRCGPGGGERTLPAGVVVGAADLHHLETRWLPAHLRTYPQSYWDRRTPGPGALLVLLGVRGELPQLAHHTLLFTERWEEGFDAIFGAEPHIPDPASLYVCRPSATDTDPGAGIAPAGHENLFVLVPIPADPGLGRGASTGPGRRPSRRPPTGRSRRSPPGRHRRTGGEDRRPADHRPADPSRPGAWRGTALGPAHAGPERVLPHPQREQARRRGVLRGASTIPGIGLPMCLISAELVLKHIRGDTGTGPVAEPGGGTVPDRRQDGDNDR